MIGAGEPGLGIGLLEPVEFARDIWQCAGLDNRASGSDQGMNAPFRGGPALWQRLLGLWSMVRAAPWVTAAADRFSISAAMLSATLAADVFTDSRARWA